MAQKSLKVVSSNKSFFNRLENSIKSMLLPTKLSFNNMKLNSKRKKYIKADQIYEKSKNSTDINKRKDSEENLKRAYNEYLEAIDKYRMDSIYEKAKNNKATDIEKNYLTKYYRISTYKDDEYDEYRYKKQIFLLELDYEVLKEKNNSKIDNEFEDIYQKKITKIYRNLFKNYSGRLIDSTSKNYVIKNNVYLEIFKMLDKYIIDIFPLVLKHNNRKSIEDAILPYDAYRSYIGKLNERENLEKKILLLKISRVLFTHSLPLPTIEKCYEKLLKDTRTLLLRKEGTKKEDRIFEMVKLIIEDYNENILSSKIYWEDKKKKSENDKFWNNYKLAKTDREKDKLICLKELKEIEDDMFISKKDRKLRKYYIRRLKEKYDVRVISGYKKAIEPKTYTRYIKQELNIA